MAWMGNYSKMVSCKGSGSLFYRSIVAMILKDFLDFRKTQSRIDSVDDLVILLQVKGFNYRQVGHCRHLFPRWALQTVLLRRVLYVLHLLETPNCNEDQLRSSIAFLTDPTNILPDIWSWTSTREATSSALRDLLDSTEDFSQNLLLKDGYVWCVSDNFYENIAHRAVRNDNIHLTKYLCSFVDCPQLAQGNYFNETACHIAVNEWKLSHVSAIVNAVSFDLSAMDKNNRTVLTLLLYKCVSRLQRKETVEFHYIVYIISSILSRLGVLQSDVITAVDVVGMGALSYAIATNNSQVIHMLLTASTSSKHMDMKIYLKQSILCNTPACVDLMTRRYLCSDGVMNLATDGEEYNAELSARLCFAISHHCTRSLLVLLSHKEFLFSLNSSFQLPRWLPSYSFSDRALAMLRPTQNCPLQAAVDNVKYFNNADCLRILIKFGANVLVRLQEKCSVVSNRHAVMQRDVDSIAAPSCDFDWTRLFTHVHYGELIAHDNIFSYAAAVTHTLTSSCGIEAVEAGAVDVLRYLLRCKPDAICYIPTCQRRVQADELPVPQTYISSLSTSTGISSGHSAAGNGLDFFIDYALFSCSPIITAILSSQSLVNKEATCGIPYHTHSYNDIITPNITGSGILEYLLIHTPFKALIDAQEAVSGLTPLAAACAVGNVRLVHMLRTHGARPDAKLNACVASYPHREISNLRGSLRSFEDASLSAFSHHARVPAVVVHKAHFQLQQYIQDIAATAEVARESINTVDSAIFQEIISLHISDKPSAISSYNTRNVGISFIPPDKRQVIEHILSVLDALLLYTNKASSAQDKLIFHSHISKSAGAYLTVAHHAIRICSRSRTPRVVSTKTPVDDCYGTDDHQSTDMGSEVPSNLLDKLHAVEQSYMKLSSQSRKHVSLEKNPLSFFLNHWISWTRAITRLIHLQRKMKTVVGLDAGLESIKIHRFRRDVVRNLDRYMTFQRIHTAHNYIVRPATAFETNKSTQKRSFFATEVDSSALYDALCLEHSSSMICRPDTSYLFPSADHGSPRQFKSLRHQSARRYDQMWWWDAVRAADWALVRRLTSQILDQEGAVGLELLVVEMVRQYAPLDVIAALCVGGATFGRISDHLELAVSHMEPELFLLILLCGTFALSVQWWEKMIKAFYDINPLCYNQSGGDISQYHVSEGVLFNQRNPIIDISPELEMDNLRSVDMRRTVLLEMLLSGRDGCLTKDVNYNRHRMEYSFLTSGVMLSKVFVIDNVSKTDILPAPPTVQSPFMNKTSGEEASGDLRAMDDAASSSSASTDSGFEECALYQSTDLTSRHSLGGYVFVVRHPLHHSLSSLGIESMMHLSGFLGIHGGPITPLLAEMINTPLHKLPVAEVMEHYESYISPEDRFLAHMPMHNSAFINSPVTSQDNCHLHSHIVIGGSTQQAILRDILGKGSPLCVRVLLQTLARLRIDDRKVLIINSNCKTHNDKSMCGMMEYCAQEGNAVALCRLLYHRKRYYQESTSTLTQPGGGHDYWGHDYCCYWRETNSKRLEVHAGRMVECMQASAQRDLNICHERREQLVSGVRGFLHHLSSAGAETLSRVMNTSLNVSRTIQNMFQFCLCSVAMRECELSFSQILHEARVSCSSTLTCNPIGTFPDMSEVLSTLGINDVYSLSKYLDRVIDCPFVTCEAGAVALQNNPLTRDYNDMFTMPTSTQPSGEHEEYKESNALLVYKQWLSSITFLLGSSGVDFIELCVKMREICVLGTGQSIPMEIEKWIIEDQLRSDTEGLDYTFMWFNSADRIVRDELRLIATSTTISQMHSTVISNLKLLQTCPDHYCDDIRVVNAVKQGMWLSDVCLPLLCLNPSDIMKAVAHYRQSNFPENTFDTEDVQLFTSKTLFHIMSTLVGLPVAGVHSISPQDLLIRLVVLGEQIVREVCEDAAAMPHALLTYQLRDTLLAQGEEALNSLLKHLKFIMEATTWPPDSVRWKENKEWIMRLTQDKVTLQSRIRRSVVVNRHILIFMKACRRWTLLGIELFHDLDRKIAVHDPACQQESMWNVLENAIIFGSGACVQLTTNFMREHSQLCPVETCPLDVFPMSIWMSACAKGCLAIMQVLLQHARDLYTDEQAKLSRFAQEKEGACNSASGIVNTARDSRYDNPNTWSLLHCLFTGTTNSGDACQILNKSLHGSPHNGSTNNVGSYILGFDTTISGRGDNTAVGGSGRERDAIYALIQKFGYVFQFMKPLAHDSNRSCGRPNDGTTHVTSTTAGDVEKDGVPHHVTDQSYYYPFSIVDILAMRGLWKSIHDIMQQSAETALLLNLAGPAALSQDGSGQIGLCCTSVLLHCAMLDGHHEILDIIMRSLRLLKHKENMEASRSEGATAADTAAYLKSEIREGDVDASLEKKLGGAAYDRSLMIFGKMLLSVRHVTAFSMRRMANSWCHGLLHDAIVGNNAFCVKRLLWISESILDELTSQNGTNRCFGHVSLCKGIITGTSTYCTDSVEDVHWSGGNDAVHSPAGNDILLSVLHVAIEYKCDALLRYLLTYPILRSTTAEDVARAVEGKGRVTCPQDVSWYILSKGESICNLETSLLLHAVHTNAPLCIGVILDHFTAFGRTCSPAAVATAIVAERDRTWRLSVLREAIYNAGGDDACAVIVFHTLLVKCPWFHNRNVAYTHKTGVGKATAVASKYASSIFNSILYRNLFAPSCATDNTIYGIDFDIALCPADMTESHSGFCDELLELQKTCCRRGMTQACCMLIQYHAGWVRHRGSSDSSTLSDSSRHHYLDMFQNACGKGLTLIAIAILKFFRSCESVAPPAVCMSMMPTATFMSLLQLIAWSNTAMFSSEEGATSGTSSSGSQNTEEGVDGSDGEDNELLISSWSGTRENFIDVDELKRLVYSDLSDQDLVQSVVNLPEHPSRITSAGVVVQGDETRSQYDRSSGGRSGPVTDESQTVPPPQILRSAWPEVGGNRVEEVAFIKRQNKRLVVITSKGKSRSFYVNAK